MKYMGVGGIYNLWSVSFQELALRHREILSKFGGTVGREILALTSYLEVRCLLHWQDKFPF